MLPGGETVELLLQEKNREIEELRVKLGGQESEIQYLKTALENHRTIEHDLKKQNDDLNGKIQILEQEKQQLENAVRNQEPDYNLLGKIHGLEEKIHKLEREVEQKKVELENAKQKPERISNEQLIERSSVNEVIDIVQRLRQSVDTSSVENDSKTPKRANWLELAEEKLQRMLVENNKEANQQEQTCSICEKGLRFPKCSKCNTVFHGECIYRVFVDRNAPECCYCSNMSSVELAREFTPVQRREDNIER